MRFELATLWTFECDCPFIQIACQVSASIVPELPPNSKAIQNGFLPLRNGTSRHFEVGSKTLDLREQIIVYAIQLLKKRMLLRIVKRQCGDRFFQYRSATAVLHFIDHFVAFPFAMKVLSRNRRPPKYRRIRKMENIMEANPSSRSRLSVSASPSLTALTRTSTKVFPFLLFWWNVAVNCLGNCSPAG